MINNVLLKRIARFVNIVNMHILVVGVHFAATLIHGKKHRLDARGGLGHEARGSGGSNGEAGNIATAIFHHILIELGIGLFQTVDVGILCLALGIVDFKGATLLGHVHRRSIGGKCQCLVNAHRELGSFISTITQAHSSHHVTFGGSSHACTAALQGLGLNLVPQVQFGSLHLTSLGIALDFVDDSLDFLHLEVDDVIHHALGIAHMLAELVEVKVSILREGLFDIGIEIDGNESAAVVRTKGNLAARIGRDGAETQVGIAVGHSLTGDGVPEEHARLGTLPSIVNDFLPKLRSVNRLGVNGFLAVDRILLGIFATLRNRLHELVVDTHRHIGAGHLAFGHLGIDKRLRVRVLNAHGEHQGTTTAVLSHLAGRVGVAFHKGNKSRRGEGRVLDRGAFGPDMRKVMPHSTTALHELHLLLINLDNAAIGVGITVKTNDKTVRQRTNLEVVTDSRHRTALRHNVAEMADEVKNLVLSHGVRILFLDAGNLAGNAAMHVIGREFIEVTIRVFQGIFARPDSCCKFVSLKVLHRSIVGFIVSKSLLISFSFKQSHLIYVD